MWDNDKGYINMAGFVCPTCQRPSGDMVSWMEADKEYVFSCKSGHVLTFELRFSEREKADVC